MADVTIPSGAVTPSSLKDVKTRLAQVAITAGQSVYVDQSNGGKLNLADADVEASAVCIGVAVSSAEAGEPCAYVGAGGTITIASAGFTKGTPYFVSATAGGIAPHADLSSGDYVTYIGTATSTTVLAINPHVSGITV